MTWASASESAFWMPCSSMYFMSPSDIANYSGFCNGS
jgi:hypothetical protein